MTAKFEENTILKIKTYLKYTYGYLIELFRWWQVMEAAEDAASIDMTIGSSRWLHPEFCHHASCRNPCY